MYFCMLLYVFLPANTCTAVQLTKLTCQLIKQTSQVFLYLYPICISVYRHIYFYKLCRYIYAVVQLIGLTCDLIKESGVKKVRLFIFEQEA